MVKTKVMGHPLALCQVAARWLCLAAVINGGTTARAPLPMVSAEGQREALADAPQRPGVPCGVQQAAAGPLEPPDDRSYLVPILSHFAGHGNQAVEFASMVALARILNRTLCLPDFSTGPLKHFGYAGGHWGFEMKDIYDLEYLARYASILPIEECLRVCDSQLDVYIKLHQLQVKSLFRGWNQSAPFKKQYDMEYKYLGWSSPADVARDLAPFAGERCAGVGGMFPGLRWAGVYQSLAAFMRPSGAQITQPFSLQQVKEDVRVLRRPRLPVHWRFYEGLCAQHTLGLCSPRCPSGAVSSFPNMLPSAKPWADFRANGSRCPPAALQQQQQQLLHSHSVIGGLRLRGYTVVGTWQCPELPAFPEGPAPSVEQIGSWLGHRKGQKASNHAVSVVEQELAIGADVFVGSGISTWSMAVWRARRGAAATRDALEDLGAPPQSAEWPVDAAAPRNASLENLVIQRLLSNSQMAGLACHGGVLGRRYHSPMSAPLFISNSPPLLEVGHDGWLDLLACEAREGEGQRCQMALCWGL
eukprot:jgi/Mesen1/8297/ME000451S07506